MFNADNLVVTDIEQPKVVYSQKGRVFEMKNRHCFGLSFCMGGQITYVMDGKSYISNRDSIVLLPQGCTYTLYGDKEGFFTLINFNCENIKTNEILVIPTDNIQQLIKDFEAFNNLFLHNKSKFKIYSAFYEMLDKVFAAESQKHPLLQSAISFIEDNISDLQLSNVTLANHVNISEVYLRKLFLRYIGATPKQYILDLRIQKAKHLLAETILSVTAVSAECGFSNLYHFCRIFKQKTGLTPTEYAESSKSYSI